MDAEEKLLSRTTRDSDSGCWLWAGARACGYGHIVIDGRLWLAHRLSYELHKGPIPKGMLVCHRCDVRNCVNPDHLWLGTHGENLRDMHSKGRDSAAIGRHGTHTKPESVARGERHAFAKMTDATVREARRLHAGGASGAGLAKVYGVAQGTMWNLLTRKTWTHIP